MPTKPTGSEHLATPQPRQDTVPDASSPIPMDEALEAEIAAAIDPWLTHMAWRKDFAQWRDRRIWQERHQDANLKDVRVALGPNANRKRILDLGTGMGGLAVALLREYQAADLRLDAMDYNYDYCKIARLRARRYGLYLPLVAAAGEQLPYGSEQFDLVICLDVLEHVADAPAVLREIYRVLRPGGMLLTTVPNRHAFRDPHYHLPLINWLPRAIAERIVERAGRSKAGGPLHDRQGLSELNTYTWGQFERLARSMGFRVRDQVFERIEHGEIRIMTGFRKAVLAGLARTPLLRLLYGIYRYGWQGTFQIAMVKPR